MEYIVRKLDGSRRFVIRAGRFGDMQAKIEIELKPLMEAGEPVKKVSGFDWREQADGTWIVERDGGEQLWRGNIIAKMFTPQAPKTPTITDPDAPATAKQMAYLAKLGDKVGPATRAMWIKPPMTKGAASKAIAALEDIAQW